MRMRVHGYFGLTIEKERSFRKLSFILSSAFLCSLAALINPGSSGATNLPVINVSGTLTSNTTWSDGNVYLVTSTLTIPSGVTLTIDAGAVVKYTNSPFNSGIQLNSGGTLNVDGTAADPVTFTSSADDTVGGDTTGDGSTTGSVGDYGQAISNDGGTVNVAHAVIEYGSYGIRSFGPLVAADSTFSHIYNDAVTQTSDYTGAMISLQRNTFNLQDGSGTYAVEATGVPDLTGVVLSGSDANTFTATRVGGTTVGVGGTVPTGATWNVEAATGAMLESTQTLTVAGVLNLPVDTTYAQHAGANFVVANGGVVNMPAGSVLKVRKQPAYAPTGIQLNSGGTLNVDGTAADPVTFTSSADDTVGGDTTGDGSTTGSVGDYGQAISNDGGTVNVAHAVIEYGSYGIRSFGPLVAADSTFSHIYNDAVTQTSDYTGAMISLQRNTFNLQDGSGTYAVEATGVPDLTGVVLSGSDANTFTATRVGGTTVGVGGTVPTGATWNVEAATGAMLESTQTLTVAGVLNLPVDTTYAQHAGANFVVANGGVVNMPAGSVLKVRKQPAYAPTGIQLNSGGTLNVDGTAADPVTFTSSADDTVGGDTTGDGSTTGSVGDYGQAISNDGGTVNVAHAVIEYGSVPINMSSGDATVSSSNLSGQTMGFQMNGGRANLSATTIADSEVGVDLSGGTMIFRGSFSNISGRYITSCNWNTANCGVDAAYVDWGSVEGPLTADPVNNLACGTVSVSPWVYGGNIYTEDDDPNLYSVRNCNNSTTTPDSTLNSATQNFSDGVSGEQIRCDNGYEDACDAITSAYACLGGAMSVAQSTTPWPLPGASTAQEVDAFGGLARQSVATYMTSQEVVSPSGFGLSFFNDFLGAAGTLLTLAGAYNSCAP